MSIQKKLDFTEENIQRLFGYEDAESESIGRLKEYYFKNDTYKRVTADLPIRLLIGHKGIGKSALFKIAILEDVERKNLPILIKPDDIAELGEKRDENFLLTIRKWKHGLIEIIGKKVLSEFGMQDDSYSGKIISFGGKLINLLLDSIEKVKKNFNPLPAQKLLLENFLKNNKIIVYIDDLDRGWQSRKEDIVRISSLLNCIRDMCNENPGLQFRISLRSDVYYLVRTSDESTDKIEGSVVWYSWSSHEILVMLIKRILTFFGENFIEKNLLSTEQKHLKHYLDAVFESTYTGSGGWENHAMYRVLLSLVRNRPRDLIKLCTLAARQAAQDGEDHINTSHLQAIFEKYSQERVQDVINEYRSELPQIERLIFGMKPQQRKGHKSDFFVFTTPEIKLKINNLISMGRFKFSNGKEATAQQLLQFLYKIDFITARKEGGNGEIVRKYFDNNRYLSESFVDFGFNWEVHPAFRWALKPDSIEDVFNSLK